MAKNSQRGRNNNPHGHNQYTNDWVEAVRDRPMKSAAAAAAAVGAGVFLWSKRNQISDQIGRLSDQISDWAEDMRSSMTGDSAGELVTTDGPNESSAIEASRKTGRKGAGSAKRSNGSAANQTTAGRSEGLNQTF